MLGRMIYKIREDKKISKTDLSNATGINVGHLTHIEKGERNPSQKALRTICSALDIPYQPLFCTYDKELTDEQIERNLLNNIPYDKIPLVSIEGLTSCPSSIPNASLAFRMPDDTMKGVPAGTLLYLELNSIPNHKEYGLFKYNDRVLVRKLMYKRNKMVLKADSLLVKDITVEDDDEFYIIGKVFVEK